MVKSKIGQTFHGKPIGAGGVVAALDGGGLSDENRDINHRHRMSAGVAPRLAEGSELAEGKTGQSRLLLYLPVNRVFDVLTVIHKPAGQGVPPLKGIPAPLA